jgi:hypothetical protein
MKGKHGTQAARKRAESATEMAEHFAEQMAQWKRLAIQHRGAAEMVPGLQRRITELQTTVGVPRDEHLLAISKIEQRHAIELDELTSALVNVFAVVGRHVPFNESDGVSPNLVENLQRLPRKAGIALLTAMGVERELRRFLLEPGMSARMKDHNQQAMLGTRTAALSVGLIEPHGLISSNLLSSESRRDLANRERVAAALTDDVVTS